MATDLAGQVALVTGAGKAGGIGFAAARCLAGAGARVLLTDLAPDEVAIAQLQGLAAQLGNGSVGRGLDITDRGAVEALAGWAQAELGGINIVFNNAGTAIGAGPFLKQSDSAWDLSWGVNVKGMVNVCRAVIPQMVANGRGAIVNNASLAGLGAVAGLAAYTASKFAVVGLTKTLAAEFGGAGIRCNAVCPGLVWTDMGRQEVELFREPDQTAETAKAAMASAVALGRWAEPDDVGNAVLYLASAQASYVSGVTLSVAGGLAPGL